MEQDTTVPAGATEDDPFGLVGTWLENKYDVQAVVAAGGFGVVYRAVHRTLHKPVAVKVLKVPEDVRAQSRKAVLDTFIQEARIVARMEHPAIVRVIDFGASPMADGESAPWMVLDWLQGTTLEQEFEDHPKRRLSPQATLDLLRPIFEALSYAHDEGIAHRDIKPGNIMLVANRRGELSAKLLDFGIAKLMNEGEEAPKGQTATRSTLFAYSPRYVSPEQLSSVASGPWTDVHAMALIVTEALVGETPYPSDGEMALYQAVLSSDRPTPVKFGVDVGPWEEVLQKALCVRPSQRYPHMRDFLKALEAALPQSARVPGTTMPYAETGASMPPAEPVAEVRTGNTATYAEKEALRTDSIAPMGPKTQSPRDPRTGASLAEPGMSPGAHTLEPVERQVQRAVPEAEPSPVVPTRPARRVVLGVAGLSMAGALASALALHWPSAGRSSPPSAATAAPAPTRITPVAPSAPAAPEVLPPPAPSSVETPVVVAPPPPAAAQPEAPAVAAPATAARGHRGSRRRATSPDAVMPSGRSGSASPTAPPPAVAAPVAAPPAPTHTRARRALGSAEIPYE